MTARVENAITEIRQNLTKEDGNVEKLAVGILELLSMKESFEIILHYDMLNKTNVQVYDQTVIYTESSEKLPELSKKLRKLNEIVLNDEESDKLRTVLGKYCLLEEYEPFDVVQRMRKGFCVKF